MISKTDLQAIPSCARCPRLREYCESIAKTRRRAYLSETYWGKPVSGFGDLQAQLVIVGLAPGAHGANRTGRVFTGDRSGEWLYRALFKAGFANQPQSVNAHDELRLKNAYITCIVKCAPPQNKPTLDELKTCSSYLDQEIHLLKKAQVWIALGQMAYQSLWNHLNPNPGSLKRLKKPSFQHGKVITQATHHLILSYHPSQQNTFTGVLTEPMFDSVFQTARTLLNLG